MICRSFEGPLAQLVEQLAFNQLVDGSNPSRPTIFPSVKQHVSMHPHTSQVFQAVLYFSEF